MALPHWIEMGCTWQRDQEDAVVPNEGGFSESDDRSLNPMKFMRSHQPGAKTTTERQAKGAFGCGDLQVSSEKKT